MVAINEGISFVPDHVRGGGSVREITQVKGIEIGDMEHGGLAESLDVATALNELAAVGDTGDKYATAFAVPSNTNVLTIQHALLTTLQKDPNPGAFTLLNPNTKPSVFNPTGDLMRAAVRIATGNLTVEGYRKEEALMAMARIGNMAVSATYPQLNRFVPPLSSLETEDHKRDMYPHGSSYIHKNANELRSHEQKKQRHIPLN